MQTIEIPQYQECWVLDKETGKAALIDTANPTRVVAYTYDEAERMIRLARIMGVKTEVV